MTENKKGIILLETKYGSICMYGGVFTTLNKKTFHHYKLYKRNGGQATEENGAIACRIYHSAIHIICDDDWNKHQKYVKYIDEYKSYKLPNMSVDEFIQLREIQDMRSECAKDIDKRIYEMGYETFLTKDKQLQLRKVRGYK